MHNSRVDEPVKINYCVFMKLRDFLISTVNKGESLTKRVKRFADDYSFAEGVVWDLMAGRYDPSMKRARLIEQATKRRVKINDWFK